MKVHYRLIINEEPKNCHPYIYRYGPTSGIELSVGEQAVLLEFNMTVSKQFDDIVSMKVQLIPDAMRKAYLIHALKQDTGLAIEKITVFIGDESRTYSKSKDSPHFPFVSSMISCENLNLGSAWNNSDMLSEIFHIVKTDADKDYRFAALYSYLSSIGRPYEIDKFSCLWTSMNALYNNIAKLYMAEVEKNHPIQKVDKILGNDSGSIGALMNILGCGKSKPIRSKQTEYKIEYAQVGDCLQSLSPEEIESLYGLLSQEKTRPRADGLRKNLKPINTLAQKLSITPYGLLLLEYPYHWRCRYFHGNRATILFSAYNDRELSILRTLNYFLSEFLRNEIPLLFSKEYFDQAKYNTIYKYCHPSKS